MHFGIVPADAPFSVSPRGGLFLLCVVCLYRAGGDLLLFFYLSKMRSLYGTRSPPPSRWPCDRYRSHDFDPQWVTAFFFPHRDPLSLHFFCRPTGFCWAGFVWLDRSPFNWMVYDNILSQWSLMSSPVGALVLCQGV